MLPSAMALKNYKGGVHLSPKQDEALEQLRQIIIRVVKKAIELKLQRRNDNMKDQILKPNYFQHKSLGKLPKTTGRRDRGHTGQS